MSSNKRIAFIGAGAIGCFYGGLIKDAGFDITLIARGAHLAALQHKGLTIDSHSLGVKHIRITAMDTLDGVFDIIVISTKSQDTVVACEITKNHIHDNSIIVSFQNGVENTDILKQYFKPEQIIGASLFIGSTISEPGTVKHSANGKMTFGPVIPNHMDSVNIFEAIINQTTIEYTVETDIHLTLWKKLLWNIAFNPLSALLESTCGRMVKDPEVIQMMHDLIAEAVEAAKYKGVDIPKDYYTTVPDMTKGLEHYKTSMFQDIEKRKPLEVDGILGPVIRIMKANGKTAPVSETIYRSLQFKYGKHYIYTPKLTVDMIVRNENQILLIERKNPPYGWALPGGFVDYGETLETAAIRELQEETHITAEQIQFVGIYSDPKRDFRMHTVSAVFSTTSTAEPRAGDDAAKAQFFSIDALPKQIAFDHRQIISDYLSK